MVLIVTGSSTKPPPSTRLTSLTSSLVVPWPMRFGSTVPRFPSIFKHVHQAAQAYEKHVAANGKPDSHVKAKEIAYVLFCVRSKYLVFMVHTVLALSVAFLRVKLRSTV